MSDHIFLIGIHVVMPAGAPVGDTRKEAEWQMMQALGEMLDRARESGSPVEAWWIAEDDRNDGSDNDSAVFVRMGDQAMAADLLAATGLSHEHSNRDDL